ncbi:MAG TPA: hypothetical protein VH601_06560 [Bryobacteraceae bacterium]
MCRLRRGVLWSVLIFASVGSEAWGSTDYIISVRRSGSIEFIEPATLRTVRTITVNIPSTSAGLNGVFANPDRHTIYVEGPIGTNSVSPNGCCCLYSIDLATLQTKMAAGIWGTRSRGGFVSTGPTLMQPVSATAASVTERYGVDRWQSSPDGRWWFSLSHGPAVDLYDAARGEITRSFATGLNESWWSRGTWLGNRFYVYATHDGSGRLWILAPESTQFGNAIPVPQPDQVPGCSHETPTDITAIGDRLLMYEIFGSKIDRRERCDDTPGGAWIMEPATGQLTRLVASTLHFWQLVPNRSGSEVYGITSEVPNRQAPAYLVRIDGHSGNVLQSRLLDSDYWWIAFAALEVIPSGNAPVSLTADGGH